MAKKNEAKAVEDKMIVGIDLGTSRSAISASNGKKKFITNTRDISVD